MKRHLLSFAAMGFHGTRGAQGASLVPGELVNVERLVLEHSSEECLVGGQVSPNLLAEARVVCGLQIRVILSWAVHHLQPKQNPVQSGKKNHVSKRGQKQDEALSLRAMC